MAIFFLKPSQHDTWQKKNVDQSGDDTWHTLPRVESGLKVPLPDTFGKKCQAYFVLFLVREYGPGVTKWIRGFFRIFKFWKFEKFYKIGKIKLALNREPTVTLGVPAAGNNTNKQSNEQKLNAIGHHRPRIWNDVIIVHVFEMTCWIRSTYLKWRG